MQTQNRIENGMNGSDGIVSGRLYLQGFVRKDSLLGFRKEYHPVIQQRTTTEIDPLDRALDLAGVQGRSINAADLD